jgi:hypothetical protein
MNGFTPGREYDAALHLLDRQIIGPRGDLVAKVDDLEVIARDDGTLVITALLTGPGALGPRIGGRLGRWMSAIWRRLHPREDPMPNRVGIAEIVRVDSAVHVTRPAAVRHGGGFESWVHDHVIGRIPGVTHDPE